MRYLIFICTFLIFSCAEKREVLPAKIDPEGTPRCERGFTAEYLPTSGHRAVDINFPYDVENSNKALEHLLENALRYQHIEFDLRTTKDSNIVVIHDPVTCRVALDNVRVRYTDYEDLPKLKDGHKIPLLNDFVRRIDSYREKRPFRITLDSKDIAPEALDEFIGVIKFFKREHLVTLIISSAFPKEHLKPYCKAINKHHWTVYSYYGKSICK